MNLKLLNHRQADYLLLVGVFILAGVMRMGWPGITEFKADEARLLSLALDLAEGKAFPLHGITSSVGIPNFPMSVWLYAVPLTLWKHPYAATIFTGLSNTLSVGVCWLLVRRYWGSKAALAVSLMYAVSPWAIIYSRKIWAQNLLPLFVIGWAFTGLLSFAERRWNILAVHIVLLVIAFQLHLSAFTLVPITIFFILFCWRQIDWRKLAIGGLVSLGLLSPFLFFILFRVQDIWGAISQIGESNSAPAFEALRFVQHITAGSNLHSLTGTSFREYLSLAPDLTWLYWLWSAFAVVGLSGLIWNLSSKDPNFKLVADDQSASPRQAIASNIPALFIVMWIALPAILFSIGFIDIFPHYLIVAIPAVYIACAWIFRAVHQSSRFRSGKVIFWTALTLTAGMQVWSMFTLLGFVNLRTTPGGFGTPMRMQLKAAALAKDLLTDGVGWEVLVVSPGNSPEDSDTPAVYATLLRNLPHRFVDGRNSAVWPFGPSVVIITDEELPARDVYAQWQRALQVVPLRVGEGAIEILSLPPQEDGVVIQQQGTTSASLDNGVRILGYNRVDGGTWSVAWHVGVPEPEDHHLFNQLIDTNGNVVAQDDRSVFPAHSWQSGDLVMSFFAAPSADVKSATAIRIGMYTYPELVNAQVIDEAGNRAGEFVLLDWPAS